jgi:hypothetical protein
VAGADELEEQVGGLGLEGDVANLVHDQQRIASEADELVLQPAACVGVGEPGDPLGGGGEQHPVAGLAGPDAQADGQMGLAGAGWARRRGAGSCRRLRGCSARRWSISCAAIWSWSSPTSTSCAPAGRPLGSPRGWPGTCPPASTWSCCQGPSHRSGSSDCVAAAKCWRSTAACVRSAWRRPASCLHGGDRGLAHTDLGCGARLARQFCRAQQRPGHLPAAHPGGQRAGRVEPEQLPPPSSSYRVGLRCARAAGSAPGSSSGRPNSGKTAGIMNAVTSLTRVPSSVITSSASAT